MSTESSTTPLETLGEQDSIWLNRYGNVHMNVFGKPLRVMDHGAGTRIWDVDGNEYLDFLAGIAVNSLGYAHPEWVRTIADQAAKVAHTSNYFATEVQIELATKLIALAKAPSGSHVYFGNSGAEGNEAALKLARLYGRTLPGALPDIGGRPARIIALTHGFHDGCFERHLEAVDSNAVRAARTRRAVCVSRRRGRHA